MAEAVQLEAPVLANREMASGHFRLSLAVPPIAAAVLPGQFVMLRCPDGADPLLPRAYSVYAADPASGRIDLVYRVVGAATRRMRQLRTGDLTSVWGPLGNAFTPAPSGEMLLVGGGVGVPPLVFFAARLKKPPGSAVRALIGAATATFLLGLEEFAAAGVPVAVATDDGTRGHHGFVTELLVQALAEGRPTTVYACGPTPMLKAVARVCAAVGAACQVSLEAPMACGVGACLGCTVPRVAGGFARVCTDGAVFDATSIAWDQLG